MLATRYLSISYNLYIPPRTDHTPYMHRLTLPTTLGASQIIDDKISNSLKPKHLVPPMYYPRYDFYFRRWCWYSRSLSMDGTSISRRKRRRFSRQKSQLLC